MTWALALFAGLVAAPAVDEAWCARARERIVGAPAIGPEALLRFEEASALFPPGSQVAARARAVVGEDADFGPAFAVLAVAADESCGPVHAGDDARVRARVQELMAQDPRFAGVRRGEDLLDRLRHRFLLWLSSLLESEGMQSFASSTRTIFFVAVAAVALVLGGRVLLRMRRRAADPTSTAAHVEAARARAFAAWREEAARCLAQADARGALLAGERALLARVGEHEARAVRPARTHREIVAELTPSLSQAVAPALRAFDVALYAHGATLDDAQRFLALVDEAAAGVATASAAPRPAP